jgi:uncharacterized protein YoaH (UPF0181 family)
MPIVQEKSVKKVQKKSTEGLTVSAGQAIQAVETLFP